MEPSDTLPQDLADYFASGWLRYDVLNEPVFVADIGRNGSLDVMDRRGKVHHVSDLSTLHPTWIRPGSYELGAIPFYLSRHPYRSKRRTMSANHYGVLWSPYTMSVRDALWAALTEGRPRRSLDEACSLIKKDRVGAVVNADLIVAKPELVGRSTEGLSKKAVAIIVRGEYTAILDGKVLLPEYDELGIGTKLTRLLLLREGLSC